MRGTIPTLLLLALAMQPGSSQDPLGMVRAIELPHVEGRIDHLALDADGQRLFVAALGNNTVEVVDLRASTHLKSLSGFREPQGIVAVGSRIFVNVPDAGHIAVVDRTTMKVTATWPVTGAKANFPMALDEAGHRLFVGCRRPAKVLIFDTTSGKETGALDIVGDTDDLFYDAARKRLYVSGGAGFIDVLDAREPAALTRLAHVATAAGARTSLFSPQQNRLYLAVPHRGTQRAEIRVYEVRD
jgi:DNA-binding beta-propeller fold protein YncE